MRALILCSALALIALMVMAGAAHIAEDPGSDQYVAHPEGAMLAVTFAHADHTEQNCVVCHHNFTDDTGTGLCFDCHKTDPAVAPLIEEQFHDLCRGCHLEEQLAGGDHGPTRACIDCHQHDLAP